MKVLTKFIWIFLLSAVLVSGCNTDVGVDGDIENETEENVKEVQVVLMNDADIKKAEESKNKHIKIEGTFFPAFTGHHHTDVLIEVKKILDVGGK